MGKLDFTILAEKHDFVVLAEKLDFIILMEKHHFAVLTENMILLSIILDIVLPKKKKR